MDKRRRILAIGILTGVAIVTAFVLSSALPGLPGREPATNATPVATLAAQPSLTSQPALVALPSATPTATNIPPGIEPSITPPSPTATPEPQQTATRQETVANVPAETQVINEVDRFGVTGGAELISRAVASGLPVSMALNWNVLPNPRTGETQWWQMVRVDENGIRQTNWQTIDEAISANPGSVWMVGNEPDVGWQDNVTPGRYAEIYNEVYHFIKERDAQALVAIAGVSQPTPLRREYLDLVLDSYLDRYGEDMPIDIWNVHAFTLREELDSWGVGIPVGLEGREGILYEIDDHDDLDILRQNLVDFRSWMKERGYGDSPLVISEYGILMPTDYGFSAERVGRFMEDSIKLFQTLAGDTGYAADNDRLIQWWFWYSVYDDGLYPTGNLYELQNDDLTALGEIWRRQVEAAGAQS